MLISELTDENSPRFYKRVRDFLVLHEKTCVSLMSRFLKHDARFFFAHDDDVIRAVFSVSVGGQVLHCFEDDALCESAELLSLCKSHFSQFGKRNLFSIIGTRAGTDFFARVFSEQFQKNPSSSCDYILMVYKKIPYTLTRPKRFSRVQIIRAAPCDVDALAPIQAAYEREEVVVDASQFSEENSRALLKKSLTAGTVFALKGDDAFVAKLSINAQGEHVVQFGGIFTVPAFRRQGIAHFLVGVLSRKHADEGWAVVLFVKKSNVAAVNLYKKCGFEAFSEYKICYY
ncbi:MAG: GNAT family N-acetyltransferase [Treponema sp.]|nr:GNAT family N-acetyltransferase [Treponema sp.]